MGSEFPSQPLGRLVENLDSRRVPLSSRERAKRQGTFPYYGATGVMDYVDDYLFEGLHLLVAEDGSVERPDGRPFLQLVSGRFWVNNHAHVLRGSTPVDTRFLYYALNTVAIRPFVSGSVQAKLSQRNMNTIPVPFPRDPAERERIVEILGTLDDKIELNRRMNETLEGMARALFKSWFVDFDPVRAKMEGRWQPGESLPGLPADLYDLFPDRLVESELGEVPEGWEVVGLGDALDLNPSRTLSKGDPAPYLPMSSMPTTGHIPEAVEHRDYGSGMRFTNGDTLMARITPCLENGKTAFVDFLKNGEVAWGSTEYIVLRPKPPLPEHFAYCLARHEPFRQFAIRRMTGTSGRQRVRVTALEHYRLALPEEPRIPETFGELVAPLFRRATEGARECWSLADLRDTLIPKLISGELRLPDAEQFVEQAT